MVGVILTCTLPALAAWYAADKIEAHRAHWFKDPGGLKLPKAEVALLGVVLASLWFLGFVSLVAPI